MDAGPVAFVEVATRRAHGLILIDQKKHVWRIFARPWWDVASWLWYWLAPGKRSWVVLRQADQRRVRVRAVRLGRDPIQIGTSA